MRNGNKVPMTGLPFRDIMHIFKYQGRIPLRLPVYQTYKPCQRTFVLTPHRCIIKLLIAMKKIVAFFIIFIAFQNMLNAQENSILLTIGDHQITAEEFLRIYQKNQQNLTSGQKTDMEDYLDLFVNFKLKVIEAKQMGLDTLPSVKNEINKYVNELAKPYLRDEETLNELLREAYERSQHEIKASHILVKIAKPTGYKDTLRAYKKALDIRRRIINKAEPFTEVAKSTSDDPSVKSNGGNLGYFSALQMVYPFENAAYELEINEISSPVKTNFGYHLIKKIDKRQAQGKVKVAHLMLLAPNSMPPQKREEKKEEIHKLYQQIQNGKKFDSLARKYSEDKSSAHKGGELPWFGVGRMVPEFEKTAFNLEKPGDISQPVKTSVGWHIIKLLDKQSLGTFEEEKKALKRELLKRPRSQIAKDAQIKELKKAYGFRESIQNFHKLYQFIDDDAARVNWEQLKSYNPDDQLFRFQDQTYHTVDFINFLKDSLNKLRKQYKARYLLDKSYARFQDDQIMAYEKARLPEKYPEYKYIVNEYHDGILLFEIMDREVWSKASRDTAGLKRYYKNHQRNYMWGERFKGKIYFCDDKQTLEKVRKMKKGGLFRKKYSDREILEQVNQDGNQLRIKKGIYTKGGNDIIDHYAWDMGDNASLESREPYFVRGEIIPPQVKKLEEARGEILADYQNYLEEKWIKELKRKYSVQIDQGVLSDLKQKIK